MFLSFNLKTCYTCLKYPLKNRACVNSRIQEIRGRNRRRMTLAAFYTCNHRVSSDRKCDANVLDGLHGTDDDSNRHKHLGFAALLLGSIALSALSRPWPCHASSNAGTTVTPWDPAPTARLSSDPAPCTHGKAVLGGATLLASMSLRFDLQRTGYQVQKVCMLSCQGSMHPALFRCTM